MRAILLTWVNIPYLSNSYIHNTYGYLFVYFNRWRSGSRTADLSTRRSWSTTTSTHQETHSLPQAAGKPNYLKMEECLLQDTVVNHPHPHLLASTPLTSNRMANNRNNNHNHNSSRRQTGSTPIVWPPLEWCTLLPTQCHLRPPGLILQLLEPLDKAHLPLQHNHICHSIPGTLKQLWHLNINPCSHNDTQGKPVDQRGV